MKHLVFAVAAIVALGTSCQLIDPLQGLIPEQSLAVVQIAQPKRFLSGAEEFSRAFPGMKGKTWKDAWSEFQSGSDFPIDAIELERPIAIAFVKGESGSFGTMLYLPVRDAARNFDRVRKATEDWGKSGTVLVSDYAVVMDRLEKVPSFPLSAKFDANKLSSPYGNSISAYVHFDALKKAYFKEGESLAKFVESMLGTENEAIPSNLFQPVRSLLRDVAQTIDDFQGIHVSLVVDAEGLKWYTRSDVRPNSKARSVFQSWSGQRGSKDYFKYLSSNALLSGAFNLPADKVKDASIGGSKLILSALDVSSAQVDAYLKKLESVLELTGNRSAFNFDFDVRPDRLRQAFQKGVDGKQLSEAIEVRMNGVFELKDGEAFHQAQKSFFASTAFNDLTRSLVDRYKIPIRPRFTYQELQSESGLPVSALGLDVEVRTSQDSEWFDDATTVAIMNETLSSLLQEWKIYYHFEATKGYFAVGKNPIAALEDLVRRDGVSQPWTQSSTYRHWETTLTDTTLAVGRFSFGRAAKIAENFAPFGVEDVHGWESDAGLLGWIDVKSEGNFESTWAIGLKDIVSLTENTGVWSRIWR